MTRAHSSQFAESFDRFMRFGLKAQAQCRATLETLAIMQNPPTVIARQANIANGPRQVNNVPPVPAGARLEADIRA